MSDTQTIEHSAANVGVKFATTMNIGGKPVASATGKTFATINPATGKVLAAVSEGDAAEVDLAVSAARQAYDEGAWPRMSPTERKTILLRLASLIESNSNDLATIESLEAGKPISDCLGVDLPETVKAIRWHAEAVDKIYDQVSPNIPSVLSLVVREPVGVVDAILPWNYPLVIAALKIGPCLAAGNTMVVKPAEQTSLSTIRLAELAVEAGIPNGVLNVVTGYGDTVGKAIGLHPAVDCIGFTGSTEVGRLLLKYSADSNLKRILLECGGKSPMVVMDDVTDLDKVAEHATNANFWNMGENCTANSRLLVHHSIKDELLELIVKKTEEWIVGNPIEPSTRIGPMIDEEHLGKVLGHIDDAHAEGAGLIFGGKQVLRSSGGYFVQPTIFDRVTPAMRLWREEVFGPVLGVTTFNSLAQAIELANDTEYGLAASVFTNCRKSAHELSRAIRAGTIGVNCYSEGDVATPFGGYKLSGFGCRDRALTAHEQYCEIKTIWHDMS